MGSNEGARGAEPVPDADKNPGADACGKPSAIRCAGMRGRRNDIDVMDTQKSQRLVESTTRARGTSEIVAVRVAL